MWYTCIIPRVQYTDCFTVIYLRIIWIELFHSILVFEYEYEIHPRFTNAITASERWGERRQCSRYNGHLDSTTKLSCSHGYFWQHPHPRNAVPIRPRQRFGGNSIRVQASFFFRMHIISYFSLFVCLCGYVI